jgi:hypothetical protein
MAAPIDPLRGYRNLLSIAFVRACHDLTHDEIHREHTEHGAGLENDSGEMADPQEPTTLWNHTLVCIYAAPGLPTQIAVSAPPLCAALAIDNAAAKW